MKTFSPKQKAWIAGAALLVVMALASARGASFTTVARVLLGVAAVAGLAVWFLKQKSIAKASAPAPRLQVVAKSSLSNKASVALVEVDGISFLVVHGEGYAQLQAAVPSPAIAAPVKFSQLLEREVVR